MTTGSEVRHLYLRLLPDEAADNYTLAEEEKLQHLLRATHGVQIIKEIKKHIRGGTLCFLM